MECILLLLDHRGNRNILQMMLTMQYKVEVATSNSLDEMAFDLAILDGSALMRLRDEIQLKRRAEEPVLLPFLLVTTRRNDRVAAHELGVTIDALVVTPVDKAELQAHIFNLLRMRRLSRELQEQRDIVQKLSLTDDVSGFFNTRFLHLHLEEILADPRARRQRVSLVFFDMDKFKSVVDTHGHLLGAKVLREVAELFDRHLDPEDRIVRYGGDEYVIIMPWQTKERAFEKVECLREVLNAAAFLQEEQINLHVTASFGVATFPDDAETKRGLLAEADHCLFESKRRGRNRVTGTEAVGRTQDNLSRS